MAEADLKQRVRRILEVSEKMGMVHTVRLLLWEIDAESVGTVMGMLPEHIKKAVQEDAEKMPRTDTEWADWHDPFFLGVLYDRSTTREEAIKDQQVAEQDTRRAVEAVRAYFAEHEG